MALRFIDDLAIHLAFFLPFGARSADALDGQPAADDLDVLAHSLVGI